MKFISIFIFTAFAASCNASKNFPEKMPADFKIEYHLDGGMANMNRSITLQLGECVDEGREDDGPDYEYKWVNNNQIEFENLYAALRKLNAFTLKSKNEGEVLDRGGESIRFTINKKDYEVSDAQSNFIVKGDADAFNKAIELILAYSAKNRPATQPPIVAPEKMPDVFTIEYQYVDIKGEDNRTVWLTKTNCIDMGVIQKTEFKYSWENTSLPDFEILYVELRKLNAFNLHYSKVDNKDRAVGEKIKFNINDKNILINNMGDYFVTAEDLSAFNESVKLILNYSLVHSRMESNNSLFIPEKMPDDFKIEYHLDGGMADENRTINLQKADCTDIGKEDGGTNYSFKWTNKTSADFENLYTELRKLNAFTIPYTSGEPPSDRGGETLRFTINGKDYKVNDSQGDFVNQKDAPAFNNAVKLILAFADKNHKK